MQYILDVTKVTSKVERIVGLQKMIKSGLPTATPFKIILPKAYLEYKKSQTLSPQLIKEIRQAFNEIRALYPKRGVYAGRAYYVPGIKQPPGPRSSSVKTPEVIIQEVVKLFEFAQNNHFDKPGSEIGVIMHPFLNPKLPFGGGCITPSTEAPHSCKIECLYGNDEGVQTFPHDNYLVDHQSGIILDKDIPIKKSYLQATTQYGYETLNTPVKYQKSQILDDQTIRQLTQHFTDYNSQHGPHRLEFAFLEEGVKFLECVPFKEIISTQNDKHLTGTLTRISRLSDLDNITDKQELLFLDPQIIKDRNMDLLTTLAMSVKRKKVVLYPGSATTAHAATILRERGHILVFVDNQEYQTGDHVRVEIVAGKFKVTLLDKNKQ